ncbi:methyltransferase domain-containing protein [Streptomonospora sp. S1-112]|uniref:Protein-L-isoaspartate O-methyltransferase n=1 Tax=Streptomonospora mangrovi TaxID=2883123 RepID=A0A9X3NIV0_9ACTN|nr:methyltransferase domain-containing protein [Streptomonospora mangrovi]MDA0564502.1 methyltransferase domain-containing protein [Streptomonospora mangrovi]
MADDLVARLRAAGAIGPDWTEAFAHAPRARFIPDTVWDLGRNRVDRAAAPERWRELVETDAAIVTQFDDGDGSGRGYVTSSASMPSLVALMLRELAVEAGMRVLEIGTGTGWTAALLSARLGDERVTTVEVDPALAGRARAALAAAGFHPCAVVGDGTAGWPERAPFDRVIATAAVRWVPHAWVAQTRPGGRILTPWGTAFHNGTLLRLEVAGDGTAHGHFDGDAGFMWVRGQRTPHGAVEDRVLPGHDYAETATALHPYEAVGDFDASFAVGLRVPDTACTVVCDGDDPASECFTVYLAAPEADSWASWRVTPDTVGAYRVRQHGRRRLFDEVAAAYAWWVGAGRPAHSRFGVTVGPAGQRVWMATGRGERGRRVPVADRGR